MIAQQIFLSIVRSLLIAGGTAAASRGVLQGSDVELLAGAGVTLAAGVWGAVDKVIAERKAQRRVNVAEILAKNEPRNTVYTEQQRAEITGNG